MTSPISNRLPFFARTPQKIEDIPLASYSTSGSDLIQNIHEILANGHVKKEDYLHQLESLYGTEKIKKLKKYHLFLSLPIPLGKYLPFGKYVSFEKYLPTTLNSQSLVHLHAILGNSATKESLQIFLNNAQNNPEILNLINLPENEKNNSLVDNLSPQAFDALYYAYQNLPKMLYGNMDLNVPLSTLPDNRSFAIIRYIRKLAQILANPDRTPDGMYQGPDALARILAYGKTENMEIGSIIPIYNRDLQTKVYYRLSEKINELGLHMYLLTPVGRSDAPIQVLFRGTKGIRSILRDLRNPIKVGKYEFEILKNRIINIIDYQANLSGNHTFEITGHSLGGIDSLRLTELLAYRYANSGGTPYKIKTTVFGSPRPEKELGFRWESSLSKINNITNNQFEVSIKYALNENDLFTTPGHSYLENPNNYSFVQVSGFVQNGTSLLDPRGNHCDPFYDESANLNTLNGRRYRRYNAANHADLETAHASLDQNDYIYVLNNDKEDVQTTYSLLSRVQQDKLAHLEDQVTRSRRIEQAVLGRGKQGILPVISRRFHKKAF